MYETCSGPLVNFSFSHCVSVIDDFQRGMTGKRKPRKI
jgi:hypothetical protein